MTTLANAARNLLVFEAADAEDERYIAMAEDATENGLTTAEYRRRLLEDLQHAANAATVSPAEREPFEPADPQDMAEDLAEFRDSAGGARDVAYQRGGEDFCGCQLHGLNAGLWDRDASARFWRYSGQLLRDYCDGWDNAASGVH